MNERMYQTLKKIPSESNIKDSKKPLDMINKTISKVKSVKKVRSIRQNTEALGFAGNLSFENSRLSNDVKVFP